MKSSVESSVPERFFVTPRDEKDAESMRRGELHSILCRLVQNYGLEDVKWMTRNVENDILDAED
jgi:hypothetical protein